MLIISVEIMKTIDERERCNTMCVVMASLIFSKFDLKIKEALHINSKKT